MASRTASSAIIYTLIGRVGVVVINTATGIIMARTLGPAGRGAASAIQLWPVILSGLLTFGVPVALRYNVRRKSDDPAQLFSVSLVMSTLFGVFATCVGIVLIPHILVHYSPAVTRFAQAMMLFAPFMTVNLLLMGYLESRGEFGRSNSMLYFPPLGTLTLLVLLYFAHKLSVFSVPLAYELPYSCITIATLYRLRGSIRFPTQFVARGKLLLHYGLRAYGLDVLNTLSLQIGQLLVIGLLSAASFGLYAVALNASKTLAVVGASLNTVLFPKAAELEKAGAVALVNRSTRLVFSANLFAGALLVAAMPALVRLAYGNAYGAVVHLAQVLTVEVILSATVSTMTQAFMATGRPGLVTVFQAIGLCTSIPLMLILIPRFGVSGAAYALLFSTSFRFALVLGSYPVFLQNAVPRLVPTLGDLRDLRTRFQHAGA